MKKSTSLTIKSLFLGYFLFIFLWLLVTGDIHGGVELTILGIHLPLMDGILGFILKGLYLVIAMTLVSILSLTLGQFVLGLFKPSGRSVSSSDVVNSGKVKWFKNDKGFGFIEMEDGTDIFVHFKSIKVDGHKTLFKGQEVTFNVTQSEKGPQAENVVPV